MTAPLLSTKLFIPSLRTNLVSRLRLIKQLNTGLSTKLILVSAPAGFGKSTIISDWAAQTEIASRTAWLSLDDRDNDLVRFLSYFIAALQTVKSDIGSGLQAALQAHRDINPEIILTNLLNEIALLSDNLILILDDYHVIESRSIDQAISFVLEHLPPQFHLGISSRIDPNLPLSRLRAGGQMTEIRADDLRFTPDETAEFLSQVMGFDLTTADLAALDERTEGWIAGLQLAALSMRGCEDIHTFIRSFTGSNRYILDYLGEEVLAHQPQAIRDFLMQTSILNRLNALLCDAVCFDEAHRDFKSRDILESLESSNLFIVPLDYEQQWYRYHHLFADLLLYQLKRQHPDLIPSLHQRASAWYQQNGISDQAVFHALAGGALENAADLIEANAMAVITAGEIYTISNWLNQLSDEMIRSRPGLCLAQAWQYYITGRTQKATQWLDILDTQLDFTDESQLGKIDIADLPNKEIWEAMATIRSTIYAWQGKARHAIEFSSWALEKMPDGNLNNQCILEWNLAFASRLVGDVKRAEKAYLSAIEVGKAVNNPLTVLNATVGLAQLYVLLGRLKEAENTFIRVIQLGNEYRMPYSVSLGSANIGLARVFYHQNQLGRADEHIKHGLEISQKWGAIDLVKAYFCQCQIQMAQGDLRAALETIEEAIRLAEELEQDFRGGLAQAFRIRLWLRLGENRKADAWADQAFVYDADDLSELNEVRGIALARVWLAQGKLAPASALLAQLFSKAEAVQRMGNAIEICMLQSLVQWARNEPDQALAYLEKALTLAAPEGYLRVFLNEGAVMEALLTRLLTARSREFSGHEQVILSAFGHKLLTAFQEDNRTQRQSPGESLIEELSPREIEILQLIAQGLSNKEICERLFLALNTVKGYNSRIFGKLGVQNRTEAASRARKLGLL